MRILYYFKWPLIIFIAGCIIRTSGVLVKIMHWFSADMIIITGTALMVIGLLFLIVKLIPLRKNGWQPTDKI